MKRKEFTEEQISYAPPQAETSTPVAETCPEADPISWTVRRPVQDGGLPLTHPRRSLPCKGSSPCR